MFILSMRNIDEDKTGTRIIATTKEHSRENIIVKATSLKICPIIPSFDWNIIMGKNIHTEVSVLAVIDIIISWEPKTAATLGFASFWRYA